MRTPLSLALLGLLLHGAFAWTVPRPVDWDPRYYRHVAEHILAGEGAVTEAVWTLSWLPEALPVAADLHWMPLPSRVLVPGLWLWPAHGDQLVTVLLAACWGPLAWALARSLGAGGLAVVLAGVLGASGGGYARFLSTPDCVALYGALGGGLWLAIAGRRWGLAAALLALAGLTRGDAFLLGGCAALGLIGRASPRVWAPLGLCALGGNLAWQARNLLVEPEGALALRQATLRSLDYRAFVLGEVGAPGLFERLSAALTSWPGQLGVLAMMGLFLLPWPAIAGAWRAREQAWVRGALAFAAIGPLVALTLAPAVTASGSVFRGGAALFCAGCALAALGVERLSSWAQRSRGYAPAFLPGLFGAAFLLGSVGIGLANARLAPSPAPRCPPEGSVAPGEVIFASDPLALALDCDQAAVILPRGLAPERARAIAERYAIRAASPADPGLESRGQGADPDSLQESLPGWVIGEDGLARPRGQ